MRGIDLAELPAEARETLKLIDAGGPFSYRRDGGVFQNRERRLPAPPRGHYRESASYTHLPAHQNVLELVCRLLL